MSVVDSDFEELKQFNLAEIYDPTPKPDAEKRTPSTKDSEEVADLKPDADEGKDPTPNADAEKSIDATPEEETEHHIPTPGLKEAQADPFPSAEDGNGACSKASAGAK